VGAQLRPVWRVLNRDSRAHAALAAAVVAACSREASPMTSVTVSNLAFMVILRAIRPPRVRAAQVLPAAAHLAYHPFSAHATIVNDRR